MDTLTSKSGTQIVVPEGATKVEVVLREGEAEKLLDPKPPVRIDIVGVIGAPYEFLSHRLRDDFQINLFRSHILVNREKVSILLIVNEDDEYIQGKVEGILQAHPKFKEFGINTGKNWSPNDLGQFFKMNRAFFKDIALNMDIVDKLLNFEANIDSKIEKQKAENGSFKDNFSGVVTSNLPPKFKVNLPLFKGQPSEEIEVEFYASVSGREISLQLWSPGANMALEELRDKVIEEQIAKFRELAPNLVIIEQ